MKYLRSRQEGSSENFLTVQCLSKPQSLHNLPITEWQTFPMWSNMLGKFGKYCGWLYIPYRDKGCSVTRIHTYFLDFCSNMKPKNFEELIIPELASDDHMLSWDPLDAAILDDTRQWCTIPIPESESIPESLWFWLESESGISNCVGIGIMHWSPGIGIRVLKISDRGRWLGLAYRISVGVAVESESKNFDWNQRIIAGNGLRIRNFRNAGIGIKMCAESCITDTRCFPPSYPLAVLSWESKPGWDRTDKRFST